MTHAEALCAFIKDEISFGRLKAGDRLPTIHELSSMEGLTFRLARGVVERLAREGYVRSRPRLGTFVLPRDVVAFRGRVLFVMPDVDVSSYHVSQIKDALRKSLTKAGYVFVTTVFPQDPRGSLALLSHELTNMPELVMAMYATPCVREYLRKSGANCVFLYGDEPEAGAGAWIRFTSEPAIANFVAHCVRSGVRSVKEVRFDGNDTPDAIQALASKGISSSMMTIRRNNLFGRYEGIVRASYETFLNFPRSRFPDLFLFWDDFVAQGALTAFLKRGVRLPGDVKVVALSNRGLGPVYPEPLTRFECDAVGAGETVASYALAVLAKGRPPPVPLISPNYIFGSTFPY